METKSSFIEECMKLNLFTHTLKEVVDLFEEKERIKSITYSGISTNFRSGGMNYRFGNIKPFPNRESYWDNFDRCGLFMLNNRKIKNILFIMLTILYFCSIKSFD